MNVLMLADSVRSADLRHVVPVPIGDPFVYVETTDRRYAFIQSFEVASLQGINGLTVKALEDFGRGEVLARGSSPRRALVQTVVRLCDDLEITEAVVPPDFPLDAAEYLRASGVTLEIKPDVFEMRRRKKTHGEVTGLKYILEAAERGLNVVRDNLAARREMTSEAMRTAVRRMLSCEDIYFAYLFISHGEQSASYYNPGTGMISEGEPVIVDFGLRDNVSGCWADITRTFYVGSAPPEIRRYFSLCKSALDLVYSRLGPGVAGAELFHSVCDLFEAEGFETPRTAAGSGVPEDGFVHRLGHGIGLEIHEPPFLNAAGPALVPGDVIAVEPGLYRRGVGGCRLEDTVLITEDGYRRLNTTPYDGMV